MCSSENPRDLEGWSALLQGLWGKERSRQAEGEERSHISVSQTLPYLSPVLPQGRRLGNCGSPKMLQSF